jgi:hypothetical protein
MIFLTLNAKSSFWSSHLFICSFVHSFVHSFIYSLTHLLSWASDRDIPEAQSSGTQFSIISTMRSAFSTRFAIRARHLYINSKACRKRHIICTYRDSSLLWTSIRYMTYSQLDWSFHSYILHYHSEFCEVKISLRKTCALKFLESF